MACWKNDLEDAQAAFNTADAALKQAQTQRDNAQNAFDQATELAQTSS